MMPGPYWSALRDFAVWRTTVWKTTWRLRLALVGVCLAVFVAPAPVWFEKIGSALVAEDALDHADVVIADVGESPSFTVMQYAARLYRERHADRLLLTRYIPNEHLEMAGIRIPRLFDEVLRVYTRELGIQDHEVDTIPIAVNHPVTFSTAKQVAAYCRTRTIRTAILVTSLFHSRRSALSYRRCFDPDGIKLISRPVESGLRVTNWWRTKDGVRTVLQESLQLAYYRWFVL